MQVQLEKRAAELLIVVRTEPLPQVVIVRRAEAVSPGLHQLARVRPVLACHAVEEAEDRLSVSGRRAVGALQVIEDRRTFGGHLRSLPHSTVGS
jgi:hypothetical protein